MKKVLFLAATAAVVLSSCSNEEITNVSNVPSENGKEAITISAYTPRATRAYEAKEAGIDSLTTAGSGFYLTATYELNAKPEKLINGAKYYYNKETEVCNEANGNLQYWPENGAAVSFYAYYSGYNTIDPCALNVDDQSTTLKIKDVSGESDVMAAYASQSSGNVVLDFKHLLAQVKVTVNRNEDYAEESGASSFILTSLSLTAPSESSYDFGTTLSTSEATSTFAFLEESQSVSIQEITEQNVNMNPNLIGTVMVPAAFPSKDDDKIEGVTLCTLAVGYNVVIGSSEKSYTKTATVKLAAGYLNNIVVSLSGDKPISVTATVDEWDDTMEAQTPEL